LTREEKEESVKRGPGQPKKDPSIIVGIRVPVAMAAEFKIKTKELLAKLKRLKKQKE